MNKKLATLILALTTGTIFGQSELCFDSATGSYWPIKSGAKIKYSSRGKGYVSYFNGDSLKVGDKYFFKEIEEYTNGNIKTSYWREENSVIYSYDTEKKAESIELINDLTAGMTWENADKTWMYTIVDTVSSLATPFCEFKNLLQVKVEPQNELKSKMYSYYNMFYKRGVGMVGINVNGELFAYAMPNKELNERSFIAYGCENKTSQEEQTNCTYAKIMGFVRKELKISRKKDYKSGVILFEVTIGRDGIVDNVKILETIKGAELQERESVRVLKMLPKMIPAQVDDGQPIRSAFKMPLKF